MANQLNQVLSVQGHIMAEYPEPFASERKHDKSVIVSDYDLNEFKGHEKSDAANLRERFGYRFLPEAGIARLNAGSADLDYVFEKLTSLSFEKAMEILNDAIVNHADDFNFPADTMEKIQILVLGEEAYGADHDTYDFDVRAEATLIHFFSPYPEVRAILDPYDDPDAPVETFRAYALGIAWTLIASGVNQFFTIRQPSITITSAVVQVLLYPCGKAAQLLPDWGFTIRGTRYTLNPGPWTFKEQMFVTIMVNVTIAGSFVAQYNILTQKMPQYYNQQWVSYGFQFLQCFSTQLFGFGFAGVLRRWVVYPVKAIWPTILPTIALNRALLTPEKKKNINGWTITRYKFFFVVFSAMFVYFWLPDYVFNALSTFNWMTWIAPNNYNLAAITGTNLGLGLNPISTFDWNVINVTWVPPLAIPFYSLANQYLGLALSFFIIVAVNWTNYRWTGYIPINTNLIVDNTGERYNVSRILKNNLLDHKLYQAYSPPYWSAANLVVYGSILATYPMSIIYVFMRQWRQIVSAFADFYRAIRYRQEGNAYSRFNDPLSQMMSKYKEVPDWWFIAIVLLSFALGVISLEVYPTNVGIWGFVVIILLNMLFLIPLMIIISTSGFNLGLNVLAELLAGVFFPGNGTANLILKCYGYNIDGQAESFVSDQKIAHYCKIPPRAQFRGQLVSTVFQVLTVIGVVNWQLYHFPNLCEADQPDKFTCPSLKTIYSASVMFGVIGPTRLFAKIYPVLAWCFLVGGVVAPVFYFLQKRYKFMRHFDPILIAGGMQNWAPYNLAYFTPGLYFSLFFMYYIKRRYLEWWEKYVFLLSASMTAAVAFSAIIIFFAVQYEGTTLSWWGNNVVYAGIDGGNGKQTRLDLPEEGYFGFPRGQFP